MNKGKKLKKDIVKKMKAIDVYNDSFNDIIDLTVSVLLDYEKAKEDFLESGESITIEFTNKNGSTNIVKNPYYLAIEKLRDDCMLHLRELGLTPQGLKKIKNKQETEVKIESKLDQALKLLEI